MTSAINLWLAAIILRPERCIQSLSVGDSAPSLNQVAWLQGEPIDLHDGSIHVVDFWATWCPYCITAMPRLSDLAQKWGNRVTVAAIDVGESQGRRPAGECLAWSRQFLAKAGPMFSGLHVALDDPSEQAFNGWLVASLRTQLPVAAVVDRRGFIRWMGNPGKGLEQAVDDVLSGKMPAAPPPPEATGDEPPEAIHPRDYVRVVRLCQTRLQSRPDLVLTTAPMLYAALSHTSAREARRFAIKAAGRYRRMPYVLTALAESIVDQDADIQGPRDLYAALNLTQSADHELPHDSWIESVLAQVLFRLGKREQAKGVGTQAIQSAIREGNPPSVIAQIKRRLQPVLRGG